MPRLMLLKGFSAVPGLSSEAAGFSPATKNSSGFALAGGAASRGGGGGTAVAAVTVYEMALKAILFDFAESQHPVLGTFAHGQWDRINGRIKLAHIRKDYLMRPLIRSH